MQSKNTKWVNAALTQPYKIKAELNGEPIADNITGFEYTGYINSDSALTIGNVCAGSIQFKIYNARETYTGKKLTFYCGVDVDGNTDYIKIGVFTCVKPEIVNSVSTYTAYDDMVAACEALYSSDLTFPNSDRNILNEIAQKLNVTLKLPGNFTTHNDITYEGGYTYREMIGYMAALQGCNAFFNYDGNLQLKWFTNVSYELGDNRIYENMGTISDESDYEIKYLNVQTSATDEEGNVVYYKAGEGATGIGIENPFVKSQTLVDEIFNKIKAFTYRISEFEFKGDFRLELGDVINVTTNGVTYKVPLMMINHNCDGGLRTRVAAYGQTEEEEIHLQSPMTNYQERMTAELAMVDHLIAQKIDADELDVRVANINTLIATDAIIQNIVAESIKTDKFKAAIADIDYLTADTAIISNIVAESIKTDTFKAAIADIDFLVADDAIIKNIVAQGVATKYLQADMANIDIAHINVASIGQLFAEVGLVNDLVIQEGHVTGTLGAINIDALNITAGTIAVDRLMIKDADGNYKMATYNDVGELEVATIPGSVITERTITAEHIVANSITTREITTDNLVGASGWINLAEGTFNYGNQISWDGKALYISPERLTAIIGDTYATPKDIEELQAQLDGEIEIINVDEKPTFDNLPYIDWTGMYADGTYSASDDLHFLYLESELQKHIRSVAYDTSTGISYRFLKENGQFVWKEIADTETALILQRLTTVEVNQEGISTTVTELQTELANDYMTAEQTSTAINQSATSISATVSALSARLTNDYSTTAQMQSAITASASAISATVSRLQTTLANDYSTTEEMNSAITASADTISASVSSLSNTLTKDYSTTKQMNAAIKASTDGISATVSALDKKVTDNYSTTKQMNAAIKASADSIRLDVSSLEEYVEDNYVTTVDMNSAIAQSASEISLSVSQNYATKDSVTAGLALKVGVGDNDKVVSMLNASADTINLSAGRLIISSGNFKLDKSGNVTATNAKLTGTVTANVGSNIGGWNILSGEICKLNGSTVNSVALSCTGTNAFACGKGMVEGFYGNATTRITLSGNIITGGNAYFGASGANASDNSIPASYGCLISSEGINLRSSGSTKRRIKFDWDWGSTEYEAYSFIEASSYQGSPSRVDIVVGTQQFERKFWIDYQGGWTSITDKATGRVTQTKVF